MNPAGGVAMRLISSGTLLAVAVYALVGGLLHALLLIARGSRERAVYVGELPAAGFEPLPATV